MQRRTIDFNKETWLGLERLARLMGIDSTYGQVPKSIAFAVKLALLYLEEKADLTPSLKGTEFDYLSNSMKIIHTERMVNKSLEKAKKNVEKLTAHVS